MRTLRITFTVLLAVLCAALAGCATKTDPAFLQNAATALYGVTGGIASQNGAMMAPAASQRQSGFNDFFGGGR